MSNYYMLDGQKTRKTSNILEWAKWFENTNNRLIKQENIVTPNIGTVRVSTVFLGLDHQMLPSGRPILFETMIFSDGEALEFQDRYSTYEEAKTGHDQVVEMLKTGEIRG